MNSIARRLTSGAAITLTAAALPLAMNANAAHAASGDFVRAQATVTASNLAVRTGPSAGATQISTLYRGATVLPLCSATGTPVAGTSQWYQLSSGGWVSARYATLKKGSVQTCATFTGMKLLNVDIATPAQAKAKLTSTSPSFASYIARESAQLATPGCPSHDILISAWWSSNQAVGEVNGCVGYEAMWTLKNGVWHETGWTGVETCSDLAAGGATHAIPGNLGVVCSAPNGKGTIIKQYTPTH